MRQHSIGRRISVAIMICLSALAVHGTAWSQGIISGSLTGTVQDTTGAAIPGAKVTVTNTGTNAVATVPTNGSGSFTVSDLQVGNYTVSIEDSGFSSVSMKDVHVDANRVVDVGVQKLTPGGSTTTVEVNASTQLLETTQSQVSNTFDTQQLSDLPINNGFDSLALLIPGVVATHSNNFSNTNGAGFSSNGQRGRSNNEEIDGQNNNDNSVGGPQFFFGNEEAIDQVQIITNDFSAQYGRNVGSVINYITKSGTNQYHGSAFYRYSGDFTSSLATGVSKGANFGFCAPGQDPATGCTIPVVPRYVYNLYGGNFGFPIWRDKIFGEFGYYGTRQFLSGGATSSGANMVPTPAGLTAINNAFPGNQGVAILNQLNPFLLQGNPHATGAPVNRTLTDGTTTISVPFTQIARNFPSSATDSEYLGRLNFQVTSKDLVDGRYIYQKNPTIPYNPTAAGGTVNVNDITHSIGAEWVHTFSPAWQNQLKYSFQQSTLAFDGGDFAACTISAFGTCPSSVSLGSKSSTLGLATNLPQGRIVKEGQVQENVTATLGRHTLFFGGEFDYENSPNTFLPVSAGQLIFSGVNGYSNLLQGIGTVNLTVGNPLIPFKEKDVAAYFQDDWKISPEFTANLGLRWEFFQQAINLLHSESVAQQTGPNPFWSTALPLSATTFPYIPNVYSNFEPRIGFAFNPSQDRNLVVRAGFALAVDPAFYNINLNSASAAPLVNAGSFACTGTASATVPAQCLPTGGANFTTANASFDKYIPTGGNPGERNQTLVSSNFHQPLAISYTLGIQHQVGHAAVAEIRYSGNHTSSLFQSLNSNPYLAPVAADFPNLVAPSSLCTAATSTLGDGSDIGHLHCGNNNVRTRANTAFSLYNAFQASLTSRNYHGLTSTFAYTFSKTIDNSSEIFGTLTGGNTSAFAQNPLDPNYGERTISGIDFPNVASASIVYAVPKFGADSSIIGRLANGWQVNTIWTFNSGQPYTNYDNASSNSSAQVNPNDPKTSTSYADIGFANTNNSGADTERPILSNPKAPLGTVGIYTTTTDANGNNSAPFLVDYVTGAPVAPSAVHFIANNQYAAQIAGNPYPGSGRNLNRGQSYNNVDTSVFKNTKITERLTLRIEADAFNILNRSYYGTPDNFIGDAGSSFGNFSLTSVNTPASTGAVSGTGTGVRNMTFGAKLLF